MRTVDRSGLALTGSHEAVCAYNRGVDALLRLHRDGVRTVAASVALDPTFALGHAAMALLGHELCAPVDVEARLRDARLHARRSTDGEPRRRAPVRPPRRSTAGERTHVEAVARHVEGDSRPLVAHLRRHPTDAL